MGCRFSRQGAPRWPRRAPVRLPPLLPSADPQTVRVLALLSPPGERRGWRRQLTLAPAGRRASAVVALGAVLGPGSTLLLARVLARDTDAHVRRMAAESLGLAGGSAAVRVLLRHARPGDVEVLPAVLRALGRAGRGNAEVHRCLDAALDSAEENVREAALLAAGQSHHPHAVSLAVQHVTHPSVPVRRAAVSLLDGVREAAEVLHRAGRDPDPAVASLARAALQRARVG